MVELIAQFADLAATAGVDVLNLLFAGIEAVLNGILAILPKLPAAPTLGQSTELKWANWFFPISGVVAIIAANLLGYLVWLALEWTWERLSSA